MPTKKSDPTSQPKSGKKKSPIITATPATDANKAQQVKSDADVADQPLSLDVDQNDTTAQKVLKGIGLAAMAMAKAGEIAGRQAIEVYQRIDPDVARHVMQIPLLSYSLIGPRAQPIEAMATDGKPPLIFVHGLGGSRGDFMPMAWTMWLGGRKRSYRIGFENGHGPEAMAEALATMIDEVLRVNQEPHVEIVAHSLGGLVARLALQEYDMAQKVKTLITLGSPHHGTHVARFANTVLTQALRPTSPVIEKLNRKSWPESVRGVTLWSRNDLLVLPAESAMIEGTESVEMTSFTHYSYLVDPRSWSAVWKILDGHTLPPVLLAS